MADAVAARTRRVVSLVPSLTETLLAWGVTPIACTRFCEQPTLTHVGGTKDPDIAAIIALRPDVVLMDREENRLPDAEALEAAGVEVLATHIASVADVATLATVRARLGLQAELPGPPTPQSAPAIESIGRSAFVAIWRRPWMTCNAATYGSSMLASIGVRNIFADHAATYPTVTIDEVVDRSPELILLPSEPYPFKSRHVAEWRAAMPDASVRLIDGQDLFWWGARTGPAQRRLAQGLRES
jgi:ABC-type Fe3+-hydroxamate transport system substrate-binding protein